MATKIQKWGNSLAVRLPRQKQNLIIEPNSLFNIFLPTPFYALLVAKPSDIPMVDTATIRRSSGFSLKISLKWLWKKDAEQALKKGASEKSFLTPSIF